MIRIKLIVVVILACVATGCSNKISYADAYKFDHYTYQSNNNSPATLTDDLVSLPESLPADEAVASSEGEVHVPVMVKPLKKRVVVEKQIPGEIIKEPTAAKTTSRAEPNPKRNWAAILSIIFGLLIIYPVSIITGPLAILFGLIGVKSKRRTLAIIGLCLGVLSLIILVILFSPLF